MLRKSKRNSLMNVSLKFENFKMAENGKHTKSISFFFLTNPIQYDRLSCQFSFHVPTTLFTMKVTTIGAQTLHFFIAKKPVSN